MSRKFGYYVNILVFQVKIARFLSNKTIALVMIHLRLLYQMI